MRKTTKVILSLMCVVTMMTTIGLSVNAANFVIPGYIHYDDTGLYEEVGGKGFIIMMELGSRVDIDSTNYNEQQGLGWMHVKHAASEKIGYCDAHALKL